MQGVVPHPEIAPLLKQNFVALAADADQPEQPVLALAARLENAMMLPFILFTDSEGQFREGSSGATNPLSFKKTLERLTSSDS